MTTTTTIPGFTVAENGTDVRAECNLCHASKTGSTALAWARSHFHITAPQDAPLADPTAHPVIDRVTTTVVEGDGTQYDPTSVVVRAYWKMSDGSPLDRASSYGWSVGKPGPRADALAKRLTAAIEAGVILADARVKVDVHGQTYVSARCTILARIMNAELRRLGF